MKNSMIKKFIPVMIKAALALITAILYTFIFKLYEVKIYLLLVVGAIVGLVIPILEITTKKQFPPFLNYVVVIFTFLAIDVGNGLKLYELTMWFDKFVHTLFGLLCAFLVHILFIRYNGTKMHPAFMILCIGLITLGVASLWEFIEYFCDIILGTNTQRWKDLKPGENAMDDTIWDLLVALFGYIGYDIVLLIDKFTNKHFTNYLISKTDVCEIKKTNDGEDTLE